MNHAPFLDPCTNGVGYSLLMIVPTFYLLSAFLFTGLGAVIMCWDKRTGRQEIVYTEVEKEQESWWEVSIYTSLMKLRAVYPHNIIIIFVLNLLLVWCE